MAELTAFNYFSGNSWLHHLDIRFKLIIIFTFNVISIQANYVELMMLSFPVLIVIFQVKLPLRHSLFETRYFLYFLLFIFLSRTIKIDVTNPTYLNYSYPDMIESSMICWRLFLILLIGLLFMFSSKITEIRAAVQWYLNFVPFVPEKKISLMIGLMIRFVPDILQQAADISEAQKARSIGKRKNPVFRITAFATPLFLRIFEQADTIVQAMLSRCFTENRTDIELKADKVDWMVLIVTLSYLVVTIVLDTLLSQMSFL